MEPVSSSSTASISPEKEAAFLEDMVHRLRRKERQDQESQQRESDVKTLHELEDELEQL